MAVDSVARQMAMNALENGGGGGGDSGTTNYNELENKPKINNIPLVGNKTLADLGINIPDVSDFITDTEVEELLADYVPETVFDSTIAGFYTKSETDALLTTKADKTPTYTKTETDTLLASKADKTTTYTKTKTDTLLASKADKTETDTLLASKADKTETDTLLASKADKTTTYTKTETDALLASKADKATTYTKTETDALLASKADKATTYTKAETDAKLSTKVDKVSGKGLSTEDYTTAEKTKLEGIETGANKTTVDSTLSSSSTNPVQNQAVYTALNSKVDVVTGKQLSTEDYTTAEKTKLTGLENYDDSAVKSDIALNRQTLGTTSKNLLKITGPSQTTNGVTFTVNPDGSVTADGTASGNATFEIGTLSLKSGENVHLSGCPLGGDTGDYYIMWLYTGTWTGVSAYDYGSGATAQISSDTTIAIRIRITNGATVSNLVFHPMLRSADITDDTFEPYKPSLQEQIEELRTQIANMGG